MVTEAAVYLPSGRVLCAYDIRADGTDGSPGGSVPHDGRTVARVLA